jgi:ABC-2 type transport system permease protein
MALTPLLAMVRKDLQLFFSDRRAVIMSFVVPIAIASFFGSIFPGPAGNGEPARIAVAVVDEDASAISRSIVAGARGDRNLNIDTPSVDAARDAVRRGKTSVAVIIPKGFGDTAGKAFFGGGRKPALDLLYDPSHNVELAMVRGILTEHVMQAVSKELLGRSPGITLPYTVNERAMTAGTNVAYNGYAHSFAGMGIQFLLFATANLGIEILLERQRGLWRRLRSAPVSRITLLGGKAASMTLIALMTLLVSFGFAIVVFGVRIRGSLTGFFAVSIACAVMAATFGLLVAALGRTPAAARGVTTLAVLLMVMLGGAWVPTFVFPAWLQQLTWVVPARWAVDGLDAMTWRGIGLDGAVIPTLVLLGFALVFGAIAVTRFRWEEG